MIREPIYPVSLSHDDHRTSRRTMQRGAVTSCPDKGARSSTDRWCRSILRLLQNREIEHRRATPRRSLRCSNGHHHRARGSSEREPAGHAFPSTRPRRAVRVGAAGMDRWGPGADAIIPIRASLSPPRAPPLFFCVGGRIKSLAATTATPSAPRYFHDGEW